jgi:hypothetical protein
VNVTWDPQKNLDNIKRRHLPFSLAEKVYTRVGSGLTPEELAMLEEAEHLPQVYDEDCPKLTPEQLAQFRPVNVRAERTRLIREAGIVDYEAGAVAL